MSTRNGELEGIPNSQNSNKRAKIDHTVDVDSTASSQSFCPYPLPTDITRIISNWSSVEVAILYVMF
jgi:hypothetical protein